MAMKNWLDIDNTGLISHKNVSFDVQNILKKLPSFNP